MIAFAHIGPPGQPTQATRTALPTRYWEDAGCRDVTIWDFEGPEWLGNVAIRDLDTAFELLIDFSPPLVEWALLRCDWDPSQVRGIIAEARVYPTRSHAIDAWARDNGRDPYKLTDAMEDLALEELTELEDGSYVLH